MKCQMKLIKCADMTHCKFYNCTIPLDADLMATLLDTVGVTISLGGVGLARGVGGAVL